MRIHWSIVLVTSAAAMLLSACDSGGGSGSNDSDGATQVGDVGVATADGAGTLQQDGGMGPDPTSDGGATTIDAALEYLGAVARPKDGGDNQGVVLDKEDEVVGHVDYGHGLLKDAQVRGRVRVRVRVRVS